MSAEWLLRLFRKSRRNNHSRPLVLTLVLILSLAVFKRAGRHTKDNGSHTAPAVADDAPAFLRRGPVADVWTAPTEAGCRRVYHLSSVWYHQETAPPAAEACVPPLLTPPLLRRCVDQRARRRGRLTSILLVGDSRLRHLYWHLADQLNVPTGPESARPNTSDWQLGIRWDNSPARWCRLCPWHCCSLAAGNSRVSLRFEWRPYWTEEAVATLEEVGERCSRGGHAGRGGRGGHALPDCPDLVLINGGMWYTRLYPQFSDSHGLQMSLLLRLHLSRAAAALTRLAALTRTVWKLDEEQLYDARSHLQRTGRAEMPVLHSVLFDAARQIPGLVVWSSALPDSTGFLRKKCYPLKRFFESGVIAKETLIEHCGFDSIHATKAAMSNAVSMLFAELCAADLDFTTIEDRDTNEAVGLPICCSRLGEPAVT